MVLTLIFFVLGGIGAVLILLALILLIIKLVQKTEGFKKVIIPAVVGILCCLVGAIGIGATFLVNAKKIVDKGESMVTGIGDKAIDGTVDKARGAISTVTEAGATAVSEGFVGTVDHFNDKRTREMLQASKLLTLTFMGAKRSGSKTTVDIGIENKGDQNVSINSLAASGVLVAVDEKGFEHPFEDPVNLPDVLPGGKRRPQLEVEVPSNITIIGVKFSGGK